MADANEERKPARPKSRQSLAHVPSSSSSSRGSAMRENATTDVAALQAQAAAARQKKKSRGKSLGPGGLEALTETTANLTKAAPPVQIKSILKPTIPLTPPKAIPTFDELRKRSTGKGKSPAKNSAEELLIDFSTPGPVRQSGDDFSNHTSQNATDPFSPMAQPRAAALENPADDTARELEEERERKRLEEKKAILERRAARRKSLANRRVSFAPEATLHTWSVMELVEDSTTSSASNSTRRQSSMTAAQSPAASAPSPGNTVAPTVDVGQEDPSAANKPSVPRQRRPQRDSSFGEEIESQEDAYSSSPSGDVTTNSSPIRVEDGIDSSDDSDSDGDTAMSLDEPTSNTVASHESGSSTHSSLEERLRRASDQAGTRGIDYDENGDDMSMEMVTSAVTHAFQPWAQNRGKEIDHMNIEDQENRDPSVNSRQPPAELEDDEENEDEPEDQTEEMSMDVTKAVGRIMGASSPATSARKSTQSPRRRSSVMRRRQSTAEESSYDATMEFTMMQGGILGDDTGLTSKNNTRTRLSDEGMTMEFTKAVGGLLVNSQQQTSPLSQLAEDDQTMDVTTGVGRILTPIEEHTEPQSEAADDQTMTMDDQTMAMEMTRAVGAILGQKSPDLRRSRRQQGVGDTQASVAATPKAVQAMHTTPQTSPKHHLTSVASETGSPSLALKPRLSARSQRASAAESSTPKSVTQNGSPAKPGSARQQGTPSKQLTPLPTRAETPNKTPLSAKLKQGGGSPKKLFKAEIKARSSPASVKRETNPKPNALFARDEHTGQQTPSIILRATKSQLGRRRSSGVGRDKEGIGSPQVSALLDRRTSIGEGVPQFKLGDTAQGLRFEDPQQIEKEIDAERAEEHRRESGRFVMEQEADESQESNTMQLKEMIDAMSPQKPKTNKVRGRKSLAVGGARGLLGKRPAELDIDEDEDDADSTPKRLKMVSRESSPVKQVHLPKPPTKDETTGRLNSKLQQALQEMANGANTTPQIGPMSPTRTITAASPSTSGKYKDVASTAGPRPSSFTDQLDNVVGAIDVSTAQMEKGIDREEDKISLQQFLNMTNIHFIELSTTKRRHTMAINAPFRPSDEGNEQNPTEANFVAAATTLPLLELYQHATRELKSYISSGRKIIRTIEAETLAEQPPLFREYVDARPDVRLVMDNQFRNGKANARLQSKESWYTWRSQLVDGLKSGLEGINRGMEKDARALEQQQSLLDGVIPGLLREKSELEEQLSILEQNLAELHSIDQEALRRSRHELQSADEYHLQRSTLLSELQQQMAEKEEALEAGSELKAEMAAQIAEAERVHEEHKGWPVADVLELKSRVEQIEKETGWRLVMAEEDADEPNTLGVALTMMYKDELRLFFYPSAFQPTPSNRRRSGRNSKSTSGPSAPISLTFSPVEEEEKANDELPTERRFFLQLIRSQLHAFTMMPRGTVSQKTVLSTVANGWTLASSISNEVRLLNLHGITTTSILGDEKIGAKTTLVLPGQGRVDIEFVASVSISSTGEVVSSTAVSASAIYGNASQHLSGGKARKVQNALGKEIESRTLGDGAWVQALRGFEEWIGHQGQSQAQAKAEKERKPPKAAEESGPRDDPFVSSPSRNATIPVASPTKMRRSPLAPKRTNGVVKKALPVPKKFALNPPPQQQASSNTADKENFAPLPSKGADKLAEVTVGNNVEMPSGWTPQKAAMRPEEQEAHMTMHTPIKRVGALRRSPL